MRLGLMRTSIDNLPHQDKISSEKSSIKEILPNIDARRAVIMEYARFSGSSLAFSNPDCLRNRGFMEPKDWWVTYGSTTPNIQVLALKLLVQPCSSSCCERNWSTYSFIQSLKRNKLIPARAEDLVYIHTNLCLLSRSSIEYKERETKL